MSKKIITGADLPLGDIQHILCNAECFFREDYIDHLDCIDEDVKFEDIVGRLGNPIDKTELRILADCVDEIFVRRMEILDGIEKMSEGYSVETGEDDKPITMSAE